MTLDEGHKPKCVGPEMKFLYKLHVLLQFLLVQSFFLFLLLLLGRRNSP